MRSKKLIPLDKVTNIWIGYKEIRNQKINKLPDFFIKKLSEKSQYNLSALKISDLIFNGDRLIIHGIGVYIFYNSQGKKFLYVGKCSSRHFVERISSHFDPRLNSWFNTLLKRLIKKGKTLSEADKQELINEKLKEIFSCAGNYKLCLLETPTNFNKENIEEIETILRYILKPLNRTRSKFTKTKSLESLIKISDPISTK